MPNNIVRLSVSVCLLSLPMTYVFVIVFVLLSLFVSLIPLYFFVFRLVSCLLSFFFAFVSCVRSAFVFCVLVFDGLYVLPIPKPNSNAESNADPFAFALLCKHGKKPDTIYRYGCTLFVVQYCTGKWFLTYQSGVRVDRLAQDKCRRDTTR